MRCLTDNNIAPGKTKLCGIIGDPIEHTMSPVIQNAAFKACGLDYSYSAFQVKQEDLKEAIERVRELNLAGLNVTIPHKIEVIKFLDKLDPLACKIGAVNTIVNSEGVLIGYNTDAAGFFEPIVRRGISVSGKKVVILGAGGAARAVGFILADKCAELAILNRPVEKAGCLAVRIKEKTGKDPASLELNHENLKKVMVKADILVNTTSVGMTPNVSETPVPSGLIRSDMLIYDIVYNPVETRLIREAKEKGAETISGLEMLAYQGAAAFELWTGLKAPIDIMLRELVKALERHEK